MQFSFYHRAIILLFLLITAIFSSCRCHEDPQPLAYNYMNVPQGDTAILEDLNIAGMGARKNKEHTTWIVKGTVVMDDLSVCGHVIVSEGGHLNILGTLDIAEEAKLTVKSELNYSELKQRGTVHYHTAAQ